MRTRHLLAGVLAAVALLTATACGNDTDVAKTSSTTAKKSESSSTTSGSTPPTTAADDSSTETSTETSTAQRSFRDSIDGLNSDLDAAKGDLCKLFALFDATSTVEDPSDAAETEQAVAYVVRLLNAVADATPADLAAEAESIRTTAKNVADQAKASGYDPEFLGSDKFKAFDDAAFNAAMQKLSEQATTGCTPSTTG